MIEGARSELESRVLILAPSARDGQLTGEVLTEAGIACVVCPTGQQLIDELDRGAGAAIVSEEAIFRGGYEPLKEILDRQLPWSDLPLILVTTDGGTTATAAEAIEGLGNVSVVERPVRIPALVSAVKSALRARSRQYQIRDHIHEREIAAEASREADRRKDEFLAVLAHELRNPLAPIRNALTIMKLAGPEAGAEAGLGEMLERQVEHLVRLVDDLFEVSRITRGHIELRLDTLDLAAVIRHAVETSRPLIDGSGQKLEVDIPEEPLIVTGDPIRLAQVFANLLNNASKFSEANGTIRLTARRAKDGVHVSVRDFGAGMPPEVIPRVFEMFTQGDRSASRGTGGLGIGLTLAKGLVELHRGCIDARSDGPGRGSEFIVRLPSSKRASHEEATDSRAEAGAPLPRQRILVVDDNRDSADSIGMLLKLLGADVHMTYDGPSALEAIDSYRPQVVLMDIGLPGMDGYEVARRIRERSDLDHLTLIAITGWGQQEDRLRSKEAGFQHHLVKPADPGTLRSLLATIEARPS